jgi:hypothetical protein
MRPAFSVQYLSYIQRCTSIDAVGQPETLSSWSSADWMGPVAAAAEGACGMIEVGCGLPMTQKVRASDRLRHPTAVANRSATRAVEPPDGRDPVVQRSDLVNSDRSDSWFNDDRLIFGIPRSRRT